jgi:hypothetical protein
MNQAAGKSILVVKQLLCFIPFIPERKVIGFIFFGSIEKTKCLATMLRMPPVVNIMRVYHALKIFTSFLRSPLQPLMNNNIVKDNIKSSIAEYSDRYRQHVRIVGDK